MSARSPRRSDTTTTRLRVRPSRAARCSAAGRSSPDAACSPSAPASCARSSASETARRPARPWRGGRWPVGPGTEGDEADPVDAVGRGVGDGEADALGDVGLAPVLGAPRHRRRDVEHEPRGQGPLGDVDPHVGARSVRAVAFQSMVRTSSPGLVGADLRELGAVAEEVRPVVTGEEAVDAAPDREVRGGAAAATAGRRWSAPIRPCAGGRSSPDRCGAAGRCASTASTILSGTISSASAW